jgi:hypothetical protein
MNKSNETNSAQVQMVKDAAEGVIALPKTGFELSEMLRNVLLAKDHKSDELAAIVKSKIQFIKLAIRLGGDDEWCYLSAIKGTMNSRGYFRDLSLAQRDRGIDTFRQLTLKLISDGVIRKVGLQLIATEESKEYLKKLQSL